jgi:hypothetical protein
MSTANTLWRIPRQVAEQLVVAPEKILALIESGELLAVNVASAGSSRPRWRISQEAFDQFLQRRQNRPPAPRVQRRRKATTVKEYF